MKLSKLSIIVALFALPMMASADPIRVAYDIGDYSSGGFSASALHSADKCRKKGPSGDNLFMCGSRIIDGITGVIRGLLMDDGSLRITGGALNIGGDRHRVRNGWLNRTNNDDFGRLRLQGYGDFWFEHIDMGSGRPNYFDGDTLILWGQNEAAYECNGSTNPRCQRSGWGIDLYGSRRVAVSEPETLALFGLGLIAVGFSRRRKIKAA